MYISASSASSRTPCRSVEKGPIDMKSRALDPAKRLALWFVSKCSAAKDGCHESSDSTIFKFCRWTTSLKKGHQFFGLTFRRKLTGKFWKTFCLRTVFCTATLLRRAGRHQLPGKSNQVLLLFAPSGFQWGSST